MSDSDTFPLSADLEFAISSLLKDPAQYTLVNILSTALLAMNVGEEFPTDRYNIAYRLWYLFLEYGPTKRDSDLYVLRFGRLLDDIERQLSFIMKSFEAVSVLDTEWTKLKWLIEDQQKIAS